MTQLHIVSDGTGRDTFIVMPDGRRLDASAAEISLEPRAANKVSLLFHLSSLDVRAFVDQVTLVCPCCQTNFTHPCHPAPMPTAVPDDVTGAAKPNTPF